MAEENVSESSEQTTEELVLTSPDQEEVTPETPKEKFRKVIQPVDDDNKPIGAPHVYEADTQEELIEKIAAGVANGTKKIHQLTRQATLETAQAPEGAEIEEEAPVWKPRELTEEEKFIVKTEPEKAFPIQYKAYFGRSPEEAIQRENEIAENARLTRELAETTQFKEDHPEFHVCTENRDAMIQYIQKHKMSWRKKNLEIAFKKLTEDGLLLQKPVEAVEPKAVVEETRTEATETPAKEELKKGPDFPSAIRNNSSRAVIPIAGKKGPSAEEIANMSADELKRFYPELRDAR